MDLKLQLANNECNLKEYKNDDCMEDIINRNLVPYIQSLTKINNEIIFSMDTNEITNKHRI